MPNALERILYQTDNPPYYTTIRNPRNVVREPAITLEAALQLDDDDVPFALMPAPDVSPTFPELLNLPLLRVSIRQMVEEEESRIQAFNINTSLNQAAEDALSCAFRIGH